MIHAKEIKKLTENYVVLYVEDEKIIRENMIPLLEIFFKKVYVAEDGKEGLEFFNTYPIDIIITDIQMPNINGLDMIKSIREKSSDIPVIITTAFADRDYFIASINLKVDQYLLKPIEEDNAKNIFYKVSQMLEDRKKAREFERLKIQEKINKTSEQVINKIANAYPNPCIIYMDGTISFVNEAFTSISDSTKLIPFVEQNKLLNNLFDQQDGYLSNLNEYNSDDPSNNKVSITRKSGRKIFRVIKRDVEIDMNTSKSVMYTFNDITWEEYQKVKIKSYTEMLEVFIIRNRFSSVKPNTILSVSQNPLMPKETKIINEKTKPAVHEVLSESNIPKRLIGDMEKEVLRRSHTSKTTAQEYVKELDYEILQELQELHELDNELEDAIYELKADGNLELLKTIAAELDIYASNIGLLFQFDDLAYAIRSLATLLKSIDREKLDTKVFKKLNLLLSGIQQDLVSWRKNIFIDQNSLDIHYLDSSLFSACLQIELALSDDIKGIETCESDFELF